MKKEVWKIHYNYHQVKDGDQFYWIEVGKEYEGKKCTAIIDQRANENCFNVLYDDGSQMDIYNPNLVFYKQTP